MAEELQEFEVTWQQCPYIHHDRRILFVRAKTEEDARAIAQDHVKRKFGIEWFTVNYATLVTPLPVGEVLSR